jgi:hypothetical protein
MDDITRQQAIRDRFQRKLSLQKTPEQRMRDMETLQATAWATLRRSPEGYAHFLRRNFRARAVRTRDQHV